MLRVSLFGEMVLGCDLNAKKEAAIGSSRRGGKRCRGPETGEILVHFKNKREVKCLQHTGPGAESGGVVRDALKEVGIGEFMQRFVNQCSVSVDFKLSVKI